MKNVIIVTYTPSTKCVSMFPMTYIVSTKKKGDYKEAKAKADVRIKLDLIERAEAYGDKSEDLFKHYNQHVQMSENEVL